MHDNRRIDRTVQWWMTRGTWLLKALIHYQALSHDRQTHNVTVGLCVVSDTNLACAILIRHKTLSTTVKSNFVCSHSLLWQCLLVNQGFPEYLPTTTGTCIKVPRDSAERYVLNRYVPKASCCGAFFRIYFFFLSFFLSFFLLFSLSLSPPPHLSSLFVCLMHSKFNWLFCHIAESE